LTARRSNLSARSHLLEKQVCRSRLSARQAHVDQEKVELLRSSEEAKDYDVKKAKQERDGLMAHYEALLKKQHQVPAFVYF